MGEKSRNENPLRRANFINKCFFWWLKDIVGLSQGHKDLKPNDVYDTMPEDLTEPLGRTLEIAWQREIEKAKSKSARPSLSSVLIKTYCWTYFKFASMEAIYLIACMIQPYLLGIILKYFDDTSSIETLEAYAGATVYISLMALQNSMLRHSVFGVSRLAMQIKVACSSLIYNKITKLSCASSSRGRVTSAISLLSIDVVRFERVLMFLMSIGVLPVQLAGCTYMIYSYVDSIAALSGVTLMILQMIPLQMLSYKLSLKWRAKQASNTDRRISLIDEIIAGVRAIKMYVWENYFEKLVVRARSLEIRGFLKIWYLLAVANPFQLLSHRNCTFAASLIFIWQYGTAISVESMFSVRQFFAILQYNLQMGFFVGLQEIVNTRVSIKRIEDFLMLSEVTPSATRRTENSKPFGSVSIENVTATWDAASEVNAVRNISADFAPKKIHAIVGATASGKSSLLKLMLGELEPTTGQVSVAGEISYASQEPWLFAGSVRENIIFGEAYEEERYDQVVRACALLDDFNNLPYGDQTPVGDRGMSLSGGQRARVNVARAAYRRADVYLLDDPFSAVDSRVAKILRSECIDQFLKDKTVVLVTHSLQCLKNDDHLISLKSGEIQFDGDLIDFQRIYRDELLSSDEANCIEDSTPDHRGNRVDDEELALLKSDETGAPSENEEVKANRGLSKSLYVKYVKAGGYGAFLMVLVAHFLPTALMFFFDFEMAAWVETTSHAARNQTLDFAGDNVVQSALNSKPLITMGSILALTIITTIVKNIVGRRFVYIANTNLHNNAFARLIRTSMRFFETNPAGRVMNRFSEDISDLDNSLPRSFGEVVNQFFLLVGALVFVLIINWWNVVPIVILILIFLRLSQIFVAALTKTKRLAAAAKSPVLSFITSTLAGLTTIRSCKAESFVADKFASRLDKHTAANLLVIGCGLALMFWIDMLTVGLFACTTFICIALKGNNGGFLAGQAGLVLTTISDISTQVSFMVKLYAESCILVTNVERVLQYGKLKPENCSDEMKMIDEKSSVEEWPSNGEIRFDRVNLRYSDEEEPVLHDLTFTIEPGSKVGIVGRTGAGKSSLISALFRLAKVDGRLLIDDVDTKAVDLSRLRSKISIIPQEPVLFAGSLRSNLDPLNDFDDATLWAALDSVGLKNLFSSLDQHIEKGGKNLSSGERQLICLARVAAKNNKILVLDEATANVDSTTDDLIQETVRDKFKSCTVLTIAHRLNTVMDCDKILVMDHGRVVEYDHPYVLLQNQHGYLSRMVEQSGEPMSQQLAKMAENAYEKSAAESITQITHL